MKVKPVTRYSSPKYPTKEELLRTPAVLTKVPHRWQKNPVVLAALGMTAFLTSCTQTPETETAAAPLFVHGEGIGSFGCVAVISPYFLSEEEAFDIILAEAKEYGNLDFTPEAVPSIENISIPSVIEAETETKVKSETGSLDFDGWNKEKKIVFEFVSSGDVHIWRKDGEFQSTVTTYPIQKAAAVLQKGLKKSSALPGTTAVFYDGYDYGALEEIYEKNQELFLDKEPSDWTGLQEANELAAKKLGEENLRAQVRDFIDWLKGQGMI